jgi:hypothetical protein
VNIDIKTVLEKYLMFLTGALIFKLAWDLFLSLAIREMNTPLVLVKFGFETPCPGWPLKGRLEQGNQKSIWLKIILKSIC